MVLFTYMPFHPSQVWSRVKPTPVDNPHTVAIRCVHMFGCRSCHALGCIRTQLLGDVSILFPDQDCCLQSTSIIFRNFVLLGSESALELLDVHVPTDENERKVCAVCGSCEQYTNVERRVDKGA